MEIKKKPQEEVPVDQKLPFNYHKCSWCHFGTKSLGVILSHFKKHQQKLETNSFSCETANLEEFKCQICDFKTGLKIALDRHISLAHGESQHPYPKIELKRYICDKCAFETYSLLVFVRHVCKVFQSSAPILKHKTKLRYSEKEYVAPIWFKCAQCSFKTKTNASLKKHISRKHLDPNKVKWVQCEQCPYKTRVKIDLKWHIFRKHLDPNAVKWFQCEQCPFKTKTNRNLKTHILWKHLDPNEVKWFCCERCSFKTKTNSVLKKHIFLKHPDHNEVKWFQCEQCRFKARLSYNLKKHILRKHLDPKLSEVVSM